MESNTNVTDGSEYIESLPNQPNQPINPLPLNVNDLNNLNTNLTLASRNMLPIDGGNNEKNKSSTENNTENDNTIEVKWRDLVYQIEKNALIWALKKDGEKVKVILKNLSGYFKSGELTAIMGPSGAGKSTLLECISGKRKKGLSGEVRINGSSNDIKIGLIAQTDFLINQLTVKESLIFASKLKNYKEASMDDNLLEEVIVGDMYAEGENVPIVKNSSYHETLAQVVMKQLGLEICADTKSANCSGGQRKRLSIALELISKPNILILDEPTSGLDSSACYQTVSVMQQLTQQYQSKHPIAVVATIHQPSARVFNLFHRVYVVSYDGQCIYEGSPKELLEHLSKVGLNCPQFHNPADYIAEVASGEYGYEYIVKLVSQKKIADSQMPLLTGPKSLTLAQISQQQSYPFFSHTWLLFYRSLITILRDPMLTTLRLVSHAVTAVFIGLLYGGTIGEPGGCPPQVSPLNSLENFAEFREKYEKDTITITENIAFIFFCLLFVLFGALMPTIMTFPLDMQVFKKETTNGWYSCATYYLAKTFADMPFQFIFPFLFNSIAYIMTGQDQSLWRFTGFNLVLIGIALIAQSQGLLIGALFMEDASAAVFLGPISCIPLLLFAGFFVRVQTIPFFFKPMAYISYMRYSFEALLVILYGYNRCPFDKSLANQTNEKPEWLDYLTNILGPGDIAEGTTSESFVEKLLRNLGGQANISPDGSDYKSIVMNQFQLFDQDLVTNSIIMIGFFLGFRIVTYLILLWKVNRQE